MLFDFLNSAREPISKVDTAWLRMERPTNLMMITGVMTFREAVDFERLVHVIKTRFLSFKRFNQRAVDRSGNAYWEVDPNFDIRSHVCRTALPGAADKIELQALVSQLASTPLDKSKPLWQYHLVENYQGGSALIARIHHCYADGIAMIQVLLSMTDPGSDTPEPAAAPTRRREPPDSGVLKRLYDPANELYDSVFALGGKLAQEGLRVLRDPSRVMLYAQEGAEISSELATSLTLPNDPITRFKGPLGAFKRVAWAEPLPLDEIKTIARALDATVNDVLLASVTGALRAYLLEKGDEVEGLEIRATVPVNLRPLEHAKELGNHFGLVFLSLPVGVAEPIERLHQLKRNMQALKASKQAAVSFGLLGALGFAPAALQAPILDQLSKKASAVMTNVPGPQQPLFFAGSEIDEQMFWVPQTGTIGMGVSILSYNGRVQFGIVSDSSRVPDPEAIINRFGPEFEKLLLLTLMGPWGEPPARDDETTSGEETDASPLPSTSETSHANHTAGA